MSLDINQRDAIRNANRGRSLGNGKYRNFCVKCEVPLEVGEMVKDKTDLCCDDCVSICTGNKVSGAFSPDRKNSR